ncbi:NfeD family protein [Dermacoccus nishinomiyaensis]|uniref:NfeD family protein n=1 Tax=Dermacoccus TaxID=57495 RepID=UPI0001E63F60|nr:MULTISPECIES: NfeD family protein [Dermacoccus]EFP58118.1 nodulation efficiency protein D [Dermacoccus sp. Ellin185]MBO1757220.1 NfeD family protein [Dermacoccus sp. NHGro5]MCI0152703.1 NfeD family protein [Dermacoccus nishinomiyaensis]MCT1605058.1 NfeD family protein [Dermacoccus nishinomiyaensis]PZP01745.1 MAG: NfeD family protein [Dermacoccus nishinomiyaensis]
MNNSAWLMWLGVALAMAAVEAVTVDFVFIMLALGALAGAIASYFGADFVISAPIAVAVAVGLLFTLRPMLRRRLRPTRDNTDIGPRSVVGQTGFVVEPVSESQGLVKVHGDLWSARTDVRTTLPLGSPVHVIDLQGATLLVDPTTTERR